MSKRQAWIVIGVVFLVNLIFSITLLYGLFLIGGSRETKAIIITVILSNIIFLAISYYVFKKVKKGS